MSSFFIKALGSSDAPYSVERHTSENQETIGFPGKTARIKPGDTLFFYAVGPGKFFGIATFRRWHKDIKEGERWGLVADVFINVRIYDLNLAPDAKALLPLPSGKSTASLRQHSHIQISKEDAEVLTAAILKSLERELLSFVQRCSLIPANP